MGIAGILLAAGASARMGRPKALLEVDGAPFVAHMVHALERGGCAPIVVVLGFHAEAIAGEVPAVASLARNPAPARGQLSSLQAGAAASSAPLLVALVDQGRLQPETVAAVLAAARAHPDRAVVASHEGRRGHPLVLPPAAVAAVIAADPTASLREVAAPWLAGALVIDCADPGVSRNLNTPADLAAWLRSGPHSA